MAQVETKLGRVQAVAGEGVVDSSIKAQQLQTGLSQLSTSLANFGKASEKRRIQNDIITARTAFALNKEMPGSLATEAEIAFNDMVATKSTQQFFRLLKDDAEVFGNQVLIDDEVYPDHNAKQAAFEDFIEGSKGEFFKQAQFNEAQQSNLLQFVNENSESLKNSFSVLAAKDIKALKLNETATFVQENIVNIQAGFNQAKTLDPNLKATDFFNRSWHEGVKEDIRKANPHLTQDELDELIVDQLGLLATDPDDPHPEYLEYFTEPGKRGKPALSIVPNLSEKLRGLYVKARTNFITKQRSLTAAEAKYEEAQEKRTYSKAQTYIVEQVGDQENGQRDLLTLHADVQKKFPKLSATHLKATINYANTLISASGNEGDPLLTIRLQQMASLGTLTLNDLNNTDIAKTLSDKELVKVHEQLLRYTHGQVDDKQKNLNKESASLRDSLMTALETNQTIKFGGKTYKRGSDEPIRWNAEKNRLEGFTPLNSFGVNSIVNSFLDRAEKVITDPGNKTTADVRHELNKLKVEMQTAAGILGDQGLGEVNEGQPLGSLTPKQLFDGQRGQETGGSDLSVLVFKTPVPEAFDATVHLPPNPTLLDVAKHAIPQESVSAKFPEDNGASVTKFAEDTFPSDESLKLGKATDVFDPEGEGFDMTSALDSGMKRDETGHMGSVVPTSPQQVEELGLPQDSFMLLKGKNHSTFPLAVDAERERGFKIIKKGDRYFSVPESFQEETLSIPEQRTQAFDQAAPDVPNERNDLRSLQDDAKFQSDRTIIDVISDLVTPGKADGSTLHIDDIKPSETPPDLLNETENIKIFSNGIDSVTRNNPLNLKISDEKWDGKVGTDSDTFESFNNPFNGLRAGIKNITEKLKAGATLSEVIHTISPEEDGNDPKKLTKLAAQAAAVSPDAIIDVTMIRTVKAIIDVLLKFEAENFQYPPQLINKAIRSAIK
jgi:hypothetical protein